MDIIAEVEKYVESIMGKNDASHDMEHVHRVRRLALYIAKSEGIEDPITLEVIELAALCHDCFDHKYTAESKDSISVFLDGKGYPSDRTDRILHVIKHVSYSDEIKHEGGIEHLLTSELRCVQDADRIDALGAIGIARCVFFSATRGNSIHAPFHLFETPEYIKKREKSVVQHFYDKLFKLKDMMKTPTGKYIAQERTELMYKFIQKIEDEWINPL